MAFRQAPSSSNLVHVISSSSYVVFIWLLAFHLLQSNTKGIVFSCCFSSQSLRSRFAALKPSLALNGQSYVNFRKNKVLSTWLNFRAGDVSDEGVKIESVASFEVKNNQTGDNRFVTINGSQLCQDDQEEIFLGNQTQFFYAAVGLLSLSPNCYNETSKKHDSKILLTFQNISGEILGEWWENVHDTSPLNFKAIAETMGSLCHGIILNLSSEVLLKFDKSITDQDVQRLDDTLYCIADGIVQRSKENYAFVQDISIFINVTFSDIQSNEDMDLNNLKQCIQTYLDLASARSREQQHGIATAVHPSDNHLTITSIPTVTVHLSNKISLKTMMDVGKKVLMHSVNLPEYCHGSEPFSYQNGISSTKMKSFLPNSIPRTMFGILATDVHRSILKRLQPLQSSYSEVSSVWEKSSKLEMVVESEVFIVGDKKNVESIRYDDFSSTERKKFSSVRGISVAFRTKVESLMERALIDVEESLLEIEKIMEDKLLGEDEIHQTPISNFGDLADKVFDKISSSFLGLVEEHGALTTVDKEWAYAQRLILLQQVGSTGIRRLFHLHLQHLRDHFGYLYECFLDRSTAFMGGKGFTEKERLTAARKAEEDFTKMAFGSIPRICKFPDGELYNELSSVFSCVNALSGLLEDMYEATSACGLREEEWEEIFDSSSETQYTSLNEPTHKKSRIGLRELIKKIRGKWQKLGPAKWYERLAAKVLLFCVNYVQGWILLQSLRHEAYRRDISMPKFPLF